MTVLDPETNHRLVDEVEFFMIKNPYQGKEIPRDQPIDLSGLKAMLIGSDLDFANSPPLRKTIFQNCIDEDRSTLLRFQEFKNINYHIRRELAGENEEIERTPND